MKIFLTRKTASLLLEFNKVDTEKKSLFWEKWDEKIQKIEKKMSATDRENGKEIIKDWRYNDSILPTDLYCFLRRNYPFPIPRYLFFSFKNVVLNNGKFKLAGELADKWLKDIFSRDSFYKQNKEYFTRAEVKYFLSCDWDTSLGNCYDLIDYFFNTKINANNLNLSLDVFQSLGNCFTHKIVFEYFKFLCNNKKYINDEEIKEINIFLNKKYISAGENINFKNHTYHSLKRLSDEWHISNMIKRKLKGCYDHKCYDHIIVQNYIIFICKKVKKIRDKEEEIKDICEFLRTEYINKDQDIDFNNITWQELKLLSDEWHVFNMIKNRFEDCYNHKIVHDYIIFICKNVKKVKEKEEKISDILDYLRSEYINNEQDFNFKNMTWQELKRLCDEWHLENRLAKDPYLRKYLTTKWKKSSIKNSVYEKDKKTWSIKEITTGKLLYEEGLNMHHCVFSYADDCIRGYCFIFSVSCKSTDDDERRTATVEISRDMRLTQARGQSNANIDNETANIIKIWADENKINCGYNLFDRRLYYGYVA